MGSLLFALGEQHTTPTDGPCIVSFSFPIISLFQLSDCGFLYFMTCTSVYRVTLNTVVANLKGLGGVINRGQMGIVWQ